MAPMDSLDAPDPASPKFQAMAVILVALETAVNFSALPVHLKAGSAKVISGGAWISMVLLDDAVQPLVPVTVKVVV